MTLLSVLIPSYNHGPFIVDAVESVIAQDFDDFEVIVSDDASTDRTPLLLQELSRRYRPRLRVIYGRHNVGPSANANRLLAQVRSSRYIAWLGGDDLMLPGKLQRQVRDLEDTPDAAFSYHSMAVFRHDQQDEPPAITNVGDPRVRTVEELVSTGNFMLPSSVVQRTSATPRHGHRIDLKYASDWLYFIEVAATGLIIRSDGVLGKYRLHDGQLTGDAQRNRQATLYDPMRTLSIVAHEYPRLSTACLRGRARILFNEVARRRRQGAPRFSTWPLLVAALLADPRYGEPWRALARDVLGPRSRWVKRALRAAH